MIKLRHFVPEEFKYPDQVDERALRTLDEMRHNEPGIYITINSDFRPGDPKWHGKGKALDLVIWSIKSKTPLPLLAQFIIANRYLWTGIGVYPAWNIPGLHVDIRPISLLGRKAFWWQDSSGAYRDIMELDWRELGCLDG